MENSQTFLISDVLSSAWQYFKKHWRFLILALLLVVALNIVASLLGSQLQGIVSVLITLASWVISVCINIGFLTIFLHIAKDENPSWNNFTENVHLFWKMILGGLLYGVIVFFGTLLLIVPGIYFALKYKFFSMALIENPEFGVWESFKHSATLTKGVKWKLFAFAWVSLGLIVLGVLALFVGVIVASLVLEIATAVIYVTLKNQGILEISPEESHL
jgi:uncharacterized membrane protein